MQDYAEERERCLQVFAADGPDGHSSELYQTLDRVLAYEATLDTGIPRTYQDCLVAFLDETLELYSQLRDSENPPAARAEQEFDSTPAGRATPPGFHQENAGCQQASG